MIFVDLADKTLRFKGYIDYAEQNVSYCFPVCVGAPETPSPHGKFAIRHKATYQRVSYPPERPPEEYAGGLLQLNISGPSAEGILSNYCIHATDNEIYIGTAHTEGCIALSIPHMIWLFNHVEKGHEVVIWDGVPDFSTVPDWRRIRIWPPLKNSVSWRRNKHVGVY